MPAEFQENLHCLSLMTTLPQPLHKVGNTYYSKVGFAVVFQMRVPMMYWTAINAGILGTVSSFLGTTVPKLGRKRVLGDFSWITTGWHSLHCAN